MSIPLLSDGQFAGMFAAVVSLDRIEERIRDASVRERTVYIVNKHGQVVACGHARFCSRPKCNRVSSRKADPVNCPRNCAPRKPRDFQSPGPDKRHPVDMIGTYRTHSGAPAGPLSLSAAWTTREWTPVSRN